MANTKLLVLGFVSALCLLGCASTNTLTFGTEHRFAVENANSKQVVSTEAVKGAPALHPAMSAAAIHRYLDGQVKEIEELEGFGSNNSGSNSGGGN